MENTSKIGTIYSEYTGKAAESINLLSAAGSNRKYYRITGEPTLIGVCGINKEENEAFFSIGSQLLSKGVKVPKVLSISADRMNYLQEDLGNISLFDAIKNGRESGSFSQNEIQLLKDTIRSLPQIQYAGANGFDYSKCYPSERFDKRSILWDLNYFKYCFLKATGLDFSEAKLEDDFEALTDRLLSVESDAFMYRDFQSRNVMIKDGKPYFIDFQGGRRGPIFYDLSSFLWQAKANFPPSLRETLIKEYVDVISKYHSINLNDFNKTLRHFVLFRTLQVLGAYGFRGYYERKEHFINSVPFAIANLKTLLAQPLDEYPYLDSLLRQLVDMDKFSSSKPKPTLTVKVLSFSYKKGIPEDKSGNGGGFVFDCRGVHNPGRHEEYKPFTGLDANVKKFLEDDGEILTFLNHCYALVDTTVERYMERGFSNLTVCFGCTGGRHRSVYSAQHMAEHLAAKYPIIVELDHRERGIQSILHYPR